MLKLKLVAVALIAVAMAVSTSDAVAASKKKAVSTEGRGGLPACIDYVRSLGQSGPGTVAFIKRSRAAGKCR